MGQHNGIGSHQGLIRPTTQKRHLKHLKKRRIDTQKPTFLNGSAIDLEQDRGIAGEVENARCLLNFRDFLLDGLRIRRRNNGVMGAPVGVFAFQHHAVDPVAIRPMPVVTQFIVHV